MCVCGGGGGGGGGGGSSDGSRPSDNGGPGRPHPEIREGVGAFGLGIRGGPSPFP